VAELVDAHDSNSCSFGSEGSIPSFGTKPPSGGLFDDYEIIDTKNPHIDTPLDHPKYPFKLAEIADRSGDLTKRWYVSFYVYDLAKGLLVRKMDYGTINKKKTFAARMVIAERLKAEINKFLEAGYVTNSDLDEKQVKAVKAEQRKKEALTIGQALEYALEIKKGEVNRSSYHEYAAALRIIKKYFKTQGAWRAKVQFFNHQIVNRLFNYLKGDYVSKKTGKPLSGTSINNYRTFFRTLINVLRREKIIDFDPSENVPKMKAKVTFHEVYTDEQITLVKEHLVKNDPHLWLLCQFVYYCFVRPKREARALQVKHLRADNRLIITSEIGKTDLHYPVIPDPLRGGIQEWGLRDYPPDYYIFAQGNKPGPEMCYLNHWTNRYKKVKESLGLSSDHTLYSWKHTGACKLYQATKDPHIVKEQCGHASLETTMNYLRQLGRFNNDDLATKFPEV